MKVQILTTQNVEIEYDIANIGERIGAAFVDLLVMIGYGVAITWFLGATGIFSELDESTGIVLGLLLYLPIFLYHLLCEIFMDGQSFGKKAFNIKVVRMDGAQPTLSNYLLRWLIGLLEVNPFILFGSTAMMAILINGKGQRLGDMAAGTTVVRTKPSATLDQTIFAKIDEDYDPTFPQVTKLSDRDVAVIKEVLDSREQFTNPVVLEALSRKVKAVMEVESELPSLKLLRTVVKDYNYYTGKL